MKIINRKRFTGAIAFLIFIMMCIGIGTVEMRFPEQLERAAIQSERM